MLALYVEGVAAHLVVAVEQRFNIFTRVHGSPLRRRGESSRRSCRGVENEATARCDPVVRRGNVVVVSIKQRTVSAVRH
jgi:hypothetical protein